jgi:hypothetical protein
MDVGIRLRSASALVMVVLALALAASVVAAKPEAACALHTAPVDQESLSFSARNPNAGEAPTTSTTLILADAQDPYHALAEEIAQRDGAQLVGSLEEALALDPEFLLWVVSPSHLSDQVLVDFGLAMGAAKPEAGWWLPPMPPTPLATSGAVSQCLALGGQPIVPSPWRLWHGISRGQTTLLSPGMGEGATLNCTPTSGSIHVMSLTCRP